MKYLKGLLYTIVIMTLVCQQLQIYFLITKTEDIRRDVGRLSDKCHYDIDRYYRIAMLNINGVGTLADLILEKLNEVIVENKLVEKENTESISDAL